jgi:hypothetical protein
VVGDGEGGIKECWGEGSTSKLGRGFGWVLCWVHVSVKGTSHVHIANVGTAATLWPLTGGWLSVKLCQRAPHLIGRVVLLAPGGLGRYKFVSKARLLASAEATRQAFDKLLPGPAG